MTMIGMRSIQTVFFLGALLLPLAAGAQATETDDPAEDNADRKISFVVLSHIYPLLFAGDSQDIETLLTRIKSCSPESLILPGDIIQGTWNAKNSRRNKFADDEALRDALQSQWDLVFRAFEDLGVPLWIAPGNHDISSYNPEYRNLVKEVYLQRIGAPYRLENFKGTRFLFLNTTIADAESSWYGLDDRQVEWLAKHLADPASNAGFLFLHHPLWRGNQIRQPGEGNGPEAFDWMGRVHPLLRNKIQGVFAGDASHLSNEYRDEVVYYLNGSSEVDASFLHVVAKGGEFTVHPHFFPLSAPKVSGQSHKPVSLVDKAVMTVRAKRFWLGILLGACFMGLAGWTYRRKRQSGSTEEARSQTSA